MEQISSEWQGYSFTPIQSLEILHSSLRIFCDFKEGPSFREELIRKMQVYL